MKGLFVLFLFLVALVLAFLSIFTGAYTGLMDIIKSVNFNPFGILSASRLAFGIVKLVVFFPLFGYLSIIVLVLGIKALADNDW